MSNATTAKPNRSPKEGATMTKDELAKAIAAAKLTLNTALLTGSNTSDARALLKKLQGEQDALNAAAAREQAAQQARADEEQKRINESAQALLEARNGRLGSIASRFAVRPIFA